jgi:hypothetical protein
MLKEPLELLRGANPASVSRASDLATAIDLQERVFSAIAWQDRPAEAAPSPRNMVRKRPRIRTAVLAGAALVAVLLVAPAFGLIRDVLPFFDAPKAPEPVQVEFASLNTGAPAGMSPQAIADNTRKIGQFSFAGRTHTLWVAPTKQGGFCFEWTDGLGGCDVDGTNPLSWSGELVVPPGVETPTIPAPTHAGLLPNPIAAGINKAHSLAVPAWISGYVNATAAQEVVIKFSDGSTIHPPVVWVSKPIGAGFFSYDVPAKYQTETNHLVAVDALAADGTTVNEQTLR